MNFLPTMTTTPIFNVTTSIPPACSASIEFYIKEPFVNGSLYQQVIPFSHDPALIATLITGPFNVWFYFVYIGKLTHIYYRRLTPVLKKRFRWIIFLFGALASLLSCLLWYGWMLDILAALTTDFCYSSNICDPTSENVFLNSIWALAPAQSSSNIFQGVVGTLFGLIVMYNCNMLLWDGDRRDIELWIDFFFYCIICIPQQVILKFNWCNPAYVYNYLNVAGINTMPIGNIFRNFGLIGFYIWQWWKFKSNYPKPLENRIRMVLKWFCAFILAVTIGTLVPLMGYLLQTWIIVIIMLIVFWIATRRPGIPDYETIRGLNDEDDPSSELRLKIITDEDEDGMARVNLFSNNLDDTLQIVEPVALTEGDNSNNNSNKQSYKENYKDNNDGDDPSSFQEA